MKEFKRGSIWLTMSKNEIEDDVKIPYGSKLAIIISNNNLNNNGKVSYITSSKNKIKSDTVLEIKLCKSGSVERYFIETSEILSINPKYLCCYQGDLSKEEMLKITNKIANNFSIISKSPELSALDIGNRILNSKKYSENIDKIKKIKKTTSDLTYDQKKYIHDNYSKSERDRIAEMFGIYPYEKVTSMANYLRTKFKKKGYL